jgi:enoyl-[acyl-carrier protein] reductase II
MFINELLNIRYPIIQGGMAWVSDAELAAAVSNAGGLGVIAAGNAPGDWLLGQIEKCRKLTDKPFGVNVMLLSPYVKEVAEIVARERVSVVITGAGNPGAYIEGWKASGVKVMPVVPGLALVKRLERQGVDAFITEGCESGGHIGEMTTMELVPEIAEHTPLPVIAAGGICDAKTAAAAFCLGASGIQVGTRFILARECTVHENYKQKVLLARDSDVKVTGRVTGHPVRVLRNPLVRRLSKLEYEADAVSLIDKEAAGSLAKAAVHGDRENGSFMSGQCACRVNKIQTAEEIIHEIFDSGVMQNCLKNVKGGFEI